jgi:peroxiredoxin (alkyl hydroperoxide reductase subunit C)
VPAVLADGTVVDEFYFLASKGNRYAALCFYPLDFTFVCPTELIALDQRSAEFERRGVFLVTCSIDSQYTHNAWRNTPVAQGGIGPVRYVMAADTAHTVARLYGVLTPDETKTLRATFLIDRMSYVRHQIVNDTPLGRDMDELLRIVDALQHHEQHGEVCPAGWNAGKPGLLATPSGAATFLKLHANDL